MAAAQKCLKDIVDSKTGQTASKQLKGAKNTETAAKVELMKLKMHAHGDKSLPHGAKRRATQCSSATEGALGKP